MAFLISVCLRAGFETYVAAEEHRSIYLLLPLLAIPPFFITLRSPFLFDSYAHIVTASRESFASAISTAYVHPTTGDFFFRPLGYLDYWLESKWCGFSPLWWHVDGLVLHAIAIYLVLLLCRRLGLSPAASSVAALLFGIHGANPEVVSWTAARFDQLATIFILLTLILLCDYAEGRRTYFAMICVCICALLSKESAFCIPALAACCLWFRGKLNKPGLRAVAGLCAISAVLFLYRYWVIGGIGGYRDTSGAPSFLHFNLVRFLDVVAFRMWGVLALPLNWSIRPQAWVFAAILIWGIAVLAVAKVSRPVLRRMLAAIAFCVLALLPAISLASLDARLTGARIYHLATIGFALIVACLYDGFSNKRLAVPVVAAFLVLQCAALVHNLEIWRDTAQLAQRTCSSFARFADEPQPLTVLPLPRTHNGVFFLANGFQDCVYVNSGKRVAIVPPGVNSGARSVFKWDQQSQSIRKVNR